MSDLLAVTLTGAEASTVTLQLRLVHPDQNHFPFSVGFAEMLLREALEEANAAIGDALDDLVVSTALAIEGDRNAWPEGFDFERVPPATLTVQVTDPSIAAALPVGTQWHTAAYEEAEPDGHPYWSRAHDGPFTHVRQPRPPAAPTQRRVAYRITALGPAALRVEVHSCGPLPAPSPRFWLMRLAMHGPELAAPKLYWTPRHKIASVRLETLGEDAGPDATITLGDDLSLSTHQTSFGTYGIALRDVAMDRLTLSGRFSLASWAPDELLDPPRAPGEADEVADLVEVLAMAREEAPELELEFLLEGLRGSAAVATRSLARVAELGAAAHPVLDEVGILIGNEDEALAIAAVRCAATLQFPELQPMLRWASRREAASVAREARQALAAL